MLKDNNLVHIEKYSGDMYIILLLDYVGTPNAFGHSPLFEKPSGFYHKVCLVFLICSYFTISFSMLDFNVGVHQGWSSALHYSPTLLHPFMIGTE